MSDRNGGMREYWSGRVAFILAASGSAVGLGNIWKFPYIAGENGGGAFVLLYLACILGIGVPIMMAEVLLGRRGRRSPIESMRLLARQEGASPAWKWLGVAGVLTGILILSYYSVIAGWAVAYVVKAASGSFEQMSAEAAGVTFSGLVGNPGTLLGWHTLFTLMTVLVVMRGVHKGLERAVTTLMPGLLLLLLVLLGYVAMNADLAGGIHFLFNADFSRLGSDAVLVAMGHAFFTLSLGMGAIMVYGSYLPDDVSIGKAVVAVAAMDTFVALLAGLVIFPIVFSHGLEAGAGPGLLFQTLPVAFGQMSGGAIIGTMFFVMVVFAAWTSSISILEPAVSWLSERGALSRPVACALLGGVTWFIGIGTVLSFNLWSGKTLWGKTVFDLLDYLTANIMLPLGGLFIAVFVGWVMKPQHLKDELRMSGPVAYTVWYTLLRFVAPIAVVMVFLRAVGVI